MADNKKVDRSKAILVVGDPPRPMTQHEIDSVPTSDVIDGLIECGCDFCRELAARRIEGLNRALGEVMLENSFLRMPKPSTLNG